MTTPEPDGNPPRGGRELTPEEARRKRAELLARLEAMSSADAGEGDAAGETLATFILPGG